MAEAAIGTLRQYAGELRRQYLAENPGLRRAEYDEAYPVESRLQEWARAIDEAARAGETIRAGTLDDLWLREPRVARHVLHDYPAAIPAGWLNPDARKQNREHEAEMRQSRARAAGRAARV